MKNLKEDNILYFLKPKMLESYIDSTFFTNKLQLELLNSSCTLYSYEEKQYIADFNSKYNCNPHNPCTEYPEFFEGLNKIRERYNLSEIHPIGCFEKGEKNE